jgi:quercetin dioxygenase-like cupin family protein
MTQKAYDIRHLMQEVIPPQAGKQSVVVVDDAKTKVVVFAFAAGAGLAEHVAPMTAIIQVLSGEAAITVADQACVGQPGTWIHMDAKTPHSILAHSPVVMLLTLLKE